MDLILTFKGFSLFRFSFDFCSFFCRFLDQKHFFIYHTKFLLKVYKTFYSSIEENNQEHGNNQTINKLDSTYPLTSYVHGEMLRKGNLSRILGIDELLNSEEKKKEDQQQEEDLSLKICQRVGSGAIQRILFIIGQFFSQVVLNQSLLGCEEDGHLNEMGALKLENDVHQLCSTPIFMSSDPINSDIQGGDFSSSAVTIPLLSLHKLSSSLQILTLSHPSGLFYSMRFGCFDIRAWIIFTKIETFLQSIQTHQFH